MSAKYTADPKLYEKTRHLLATGNTADVLLLLFENGFDHAIDLKTRCDAAHEQFETKNIDFDTWVRIQNQINAEVLEIFTAKIEIRKPQETAVKILEGELFTSAYVPKAAVLELLRQNKTAAALALCAHLGNNHILLQARYHAANKFVLQGHVSEKDWEKLETQVKNDLQKLLKNAMDMPICMESGTAPLVEPAEKPPIKYRSILEKIRDFLRY